MTVGSWSPDRDERDFAWYLSNDWRNDYFHINASYLDIGPQFTSKMRFMHRRDIRSLMLNADYEVQVRRYGVRDVGAMVTGSYLLDHDNNPSVGMWGLVEACFRNPTMDSISISDGFSTA